MLHIQFGVVFDGSQVCTARCFVFFLVCSLTFL